MYPVLIPGTVPYQHSYNVDVSYMKLDLLKLFEVIYRLSSQTVGCINVFECSYFFT